MKPLSATTPEVPYVLTAENLKATDPWQYEEVLRLVERGVLPSVEAYLKDMNQMIGGTAASAPQRTAAPQRSRAAQRSKE